MNLLKTLITHLIARALWFAVVLFSAQLSAESHNNDTLSEYPSYIEEKTKLSKTARFLMQATLGFNRTELTHADNVGIENWLAEQQVITSTKLEPHIAFLTSFGYQDLNTLPRELPYHKVKSAGNTVGYLNFSTSWLRSVVGGDDLLRQRVAWALSQILVVSNKTNVLTEASANYYDMLLDGAFGHFEDLLLDVTYHPVMGRYLTYMGNVKTSPTNNIVPDENYARELMQLFTIGLWQLEDNGNLKLDAHGEPIPTYNNEDIRSIARILTGFWLDKTRFGRIEWSKFNKPMVISTAHHDRQEKKALNGYINVPADKEPNAEIAYLIKALANHPNTAPFISRKLIQHLVTSNPSPDYIERVVKVWRSSNGHLGKVVTAVLLDNVARNQSIQSNLETVKLKEPIVRVASLIKLLDCGSKLGKNPTDFPGLQWWHPYLDEQLNQEPLGADSVFNFFDSSYANPGAIAAEDLVSPEFDLIDAVSSARFTNYVWQGLTDGFHQHPYNKKFEALTCDFKWERELLSRDPQALVNYLDLMITAGNMTVATKQIIEAQMKRVSNPVDKVRSAVLGAVISPEGAVLQ